MSTPNSPVFVKYRGGTDAVDFSVPFPYFDRNYVKLIYKALNSDEVELVVNTDYVWKDDHTVTLNEPLGEYDVLVIVRRTDLGSPAEFDNQRRLFPVAVMDNDDLSFQQIQEMQEQLDRCYKENITSDNNAGDIESIIGHYVDEAEQIKQDCMDNANLARDWATKMDDTVDGFNYSSKYYAMQILPVKDDITTVASISSDVTAVASNATNINTVAGMSSDIATVATDISSVNTTATDISSINTTATNISSVNTAAANITAIQNAPTYANNANVWAEGSDAQVQVLGGIHSAKGWVNSLGNVYKPAGSVAFASLPTLGSTYEGYVYNVTDSFTTTSDFVEGSGKSYPAGTNVVCIDTGSSVYKWDILGGFIDLSGKQDVLVSGTNIKTINNNSILGSGNLDIDALPSQSGQSGKYLTTDGTDASWGSLATVATTGSYSDLLNKPTIPTVNNATLTITQGGVSKGTFTANASSDVTVALDAGGGSSRNIGEIIASTLPLSDAGLHLLDGTVISGSGVYADFVDYIADLSTQSGNVINATIVGSPTINDCVLSGFSLSNYAKTPSALNLNGNTWEIGLKIHTPSTLSSYSTMLGDTSYSAYQNSVGAGEHFKIDFSSTHSSYDISAEGTYTLLPDTDYWVRVSFNGSQYKLEYSLDGTTYTTDITISSNYSFENAIWYIGRAYVDAYAYPWLGSIDFKGCYVKINNNIFWRGTTRSAFTTEADWQNSVTTYGVCGKFVYDSVNNTVRLPKITGFIEGATNETELGDLIKAGLPNITGQFSQNADFASIWSYAPTNGAFTKKATLSSNSFVAMGQAGQSGGGYDAAIDASLSSSIYGNSSTVQPQAVNVLYYIVVATSVKTPVELDIDEIMADLAEKADDNAVVHLAGDESIAGVKTFDSNIISNADRWNIISQHNNITLGNAPSSNIWTGIQCQDSSNTEYGLLAVSYRTNGEMWAQIMATLGSTQSAIRAMVDANNNAFTYAPASDVNNSIVTTVNKSKSANGYFKLGNGLIIQYGLGKMPANSKSVTITLPTPYTGNYTVLAQHIGAANSTSTGQTVSDKTLTNFQCKYLNTHSDDRWFNWIAIGY